MEDVSITSQTLYSEGSGDTRSVVERCAPASVPNAPTARVGIIFRSADKKCLGRMSEEVG